MQRAIVIFGWIFVAALAVGLRLERLGERPVHADEATGARLVADRMVNGAVAGFDPVHFHGPLLRDLAIPMCRLRGEDGWRDMTALSLRLVTAIAGVLLVLVPWCWRRTFGDVPALVAGGFLAVSPLLVYYGRMFIHEMLLTCFGVMALACLTAARRPRVVAAGVCIGLMHATKETFVISLIAWTAAGLMVVPGLWCRGGRAGLVVLVREWWRPVLGGVLAAVLTSVLVYSDVLRHPQGVVDSIKTYFVYKTGEGHDKPFGWYLALLAWPMKSAGRWWFETPLVAFALAGVLASFLIRGGDRARCRLLRFLVLAAAFHFLIYGMIAYKTPWLACLPWAHVCLAAGFAMAWVPTGRRLPRMVAGLAVVASFVWLIGQARFASGRAASDARNPYAYVPTRRDVGDLAEWVAKLRAAAPPGSADSAVILGTDVWPLPWYLRDIPRTGHWVRPPAQGLSETAFVFALPDAADEAAGQLGGTHTALPRGLRVGVPVILFLRNDLWNQWKQEGR